VEYSLSVSGERLVSALHLLAQWGEDHKNYVARREYKKQQA
jgi:DNA-binding HxlR family transcriptional regulator